MARDEQGRKAGRNFASLRATFSRSTLAVNEVPLKDAPTKPVRVEAKTLPKAKTAERRQSKYTLFDLFSKPKVQTARGYHETGLETLPEQQADSKPLLIAEQSLRVVEKVDTRSPRKNIPPPLPLIQTQPAEQFQRPQRWDAPPLFQAYPQAIRYGILQSPSISADTLIRGQQLRAQAGFMGNGASLPAVRENSEGAPMQESTKLISKRFSILNDSPVLEDKMFVLVTAGRLVQYAGDGNSDRMPERVLHLGEKSAAFVCDLIPGKHWVVQVVQQVQGDSTGGGQINKSRSILSRLRGPPVSGRRSATNVLLVFGSAEDMDGWLKAIRGVIEQLGGAKKKEDGEAQGGLDALEERRSSSVIDEQISQRYRVSRPTSMVSTSTSIQRPRSRSSFSQPKSPQSPVGPRDIILPPLPSAHLSPHHTPGHSPKETQFPNEIQSLVGAATNGSPMESSVASSQDSRLERLREGSRNSMVSTRTFDTDNFTVPTSKCSSSPPSPLVETFVEQRDATLPGSKRNSYITSPPTARRLSVQPLTSVDTPKVEFVTIPEQAVPAEVAQLPEELLGTPTLEPHVPSPPRPTQRVSQNYSHPMPVRLRLSESLRRPKSDNAEPWRTRPDSVLGQLPSTATRSLTRLDSVSKRGRPLSRMVPVKPYDPSDAPPVRPVGPGPVTFPRRYSSLPTVSTSNTILGSRTTTPDPSTPSAATTANSPGTSVPKTTLATHKPRMPSLPLTINTSQSSPPQTAQQARALRRPTSMQIRSDPTPFLSRRTPSMTMRPSAPVAASNSYFAGATPSNDFFHKAVPARASSVSLEAKPQSAVQTPPVDVPIGTATTTATPSPPATMAPAIPPMNPNRVSTVRMRSSMPAMMFSGLPPPPPPPSMPLPPPPPMMQLPALASLPPNMPLPALPPGMPPPSRPPNIPLPPVPNHVVSS